MVACHCPCEAVAEVLLFALVRHLLCLQVAVAIRDL